MTQDNALKDGVPMAVTSQPGEHVGMQRCLSFILKAVGNQQAESPKTIVRAGDEAQW